jgi:hypothetical protein
MIKDLIKLVEVLNGKVAPLVEAIEKADPTTEAYEQLLENYSGTMQLISTLNRTLTEITVAAQAKAKEEGAKDESNN